ncbi:putative mediator of RNA polymerase II transcription subunit 32 [Iris pallida]|uniref:Mediator of RNA polymerase II transcription subunit 32 n=1 Tax=Iris pallida TaxID=29817 RepID=A0AAX6I780_IRIPA|nr:putative mediator of RNA polymerase II transcription subunit 32 [Iris pallida]
MESIADSLSNSYQDFVAAAAGVLEAKEQSNGQKNSATDAALESFKQCWELFKVSCDQPRSSSSPSSSASAPSLVTRPPARPPPPPDPDQAPGPTTPAYRPSAPCVWSR